MNKKAARLSLRSHCILAQIELPGRVATTVAISNGLNLLCKWVAAEFLHAKGAPPKLQSCDITNEHTLRDLRRNLVTSIRNGTQQEEPLQ